MHLDSIYDKKCPEIAKKFTPNSIYDKNCPKIAKI